MPDRNRLIKMLLDKGLAEERPGYGHATAEDVADAVLEFLAKDGWMMMREEDPSWSSWPRAAE